jgi:hypothetical protein
MERALWLEQMRYVQPKTAFSRFPRVHRADFEVHKGSVRPVRHSPGNDRYLRIPAEDPVAVKQSVRRATVDVAAGLRTFAAL